MDNVDPNAPADQQPQGTSIVEREMRINPNFEESIHIVEPGDTDSQRTETTEDADTQPDEDDGTDDEATIVSETPVILAPDPGEFKPADYTFEVTVYDENNANARTHKIKSVSEWDDLLDRDPNLGSASALLKAQRQATKMESASERDKADWQAKKDAYEQEKTQTDARTAAIARNVAEVDYLVNRGDLPKVAKEYATADWSDPEIAKQPGVKEQNALLSYMQKENKARAKAGLPQMSSILDGYNAWQLDQAKKNTATAKVTAGQARKVAGARIAPAGSTPSQIAPPGLMIGRGGSLRDLANMR